MKFKIMFDVLMILLTGGFWIIWMIVRHYHQEQRRLKKNSRCHM